MPQIFNTQLSYRRSLDVRSWEALAELVSGSEPSGLFWPLVGTRRSGKTWALRGVLAQLGKDKAEIHRLDHCRRLEDLKVGACPVLLIDEPGTHLFEVSNIGTGCVRVPDRAKIRQFIERCQCWRNAEKSILVAMTPAEWAALRSENPVYIDPRDLQEHLSPLSREQASELARSSQAKQLLAHVPERWKGNPFLLELLLSQAEQRGDFERPADQASIERLVQATTREANKAPGWNYTTYVFYEGLSREQQDEVRRVARCEPPKDADTLTRLQQVGLLIPTKSGNHPLEIGDPVIAQHLPPAFRIHHVSDVHVGRKSASRANVSGAGRTAVHLGKAVGQGPVRESYTEYIQQCANKQCGPHVLVISGDLVETGSTEELNEAKQWIKNIRESLQSHVSLGPNDPQVLVVGGNHDVDWTQTRGAAGARKRHLPFAKAMDSIPRPKLEEPPEGRELEVVRYRDAGIAVVLLGSAEYGGELEDQSVIGMIDEARKRAVEAGETGTAEEAQKLRDRLGRLDPGLVHSQDLSRLRGYNWRDSAVRIAVLHHPVSPMPSITDVAPYAGLLNAGAVKDAMIEAKVSLVLHGHQHSAWFAEEKWPDRSEHTLRIAAAPSLGSWAVAEKHGFNEILVFREGEKYEVCVKRVLREGDSWRVIEPGMVFQVGDGS